ncbi:iron ABC transporter permease [Butyricimonas sp. Marseille-P3923]|uniref:FecCD family ABC transporter permease n=1 Tax=Butyricimonas sp. Marseille-P3923 TaxID=1987504 RepID=UPI000C084ABA|nr:iron ABC transporter permease [Butyricimonas sp. Marseille-P3923]
MQGKYYKWILFLAFLLLLLAGSIVAGLCFGEIRFSIQDIFQLWNGDPEDVRLNILRQLRVPRIILGFIVGGALSLSGVILQGIFRNPLVEPYTLGISGGASVGVTAAIVLSLHTLHGSFMLPFAGFAGALVTVILVYTLGVRRGNVRVHSLLLTGVMISFISSSLMLLIMSVTKSENLHGIVFWIMGSLNETDPTLIALISETSLVVLCLAFLYTPALNAMRLGSERAIQLGINANRAIKVLFLLSSLLTGICVSIVGVIGFVGLIIPQLMRFIIGSDFRILLPSSFIGGGIFLILSDIFARTIISPNELPIGVITGIIGGIIFILVMSNTKTEKTID